MNRKFLGSEGVVLSKRKLGDADQIVTLFTKDLGKIAVVAKGIRKLTSRKRGSLEVFNTIKFAATKTKSLPIITEVETVNSPNYEKSLKKISVAYFFVEVADKLTREDEKNSELFVLLNKYLSNLERETKLKNLRHKFIYEILVLVGFWPAERQMPDPDAVIEGVIEKRLGSIRVGKKLQ